MKKIGKHVLNVKNNVQVSQSGDLSIDTIGIINKMASALLQRKNLGSIKMIIPKKYVETVNGLVLITDYLESIVSGNPWSREKLMKEVAKAIISFKFLSR